MKKNTIEKLSVYFLTVSLVLTASKPVYMLYLLETLASINSIIIAFAFIVIYSFFVKTFNSRKLLISISILTIYHILLHIQFQEFYPRFFLIFLTLIIISFISIRYLGRNIFTYMEKTIFVFSLITIPFYLWAIIHPDSLTGILRPIYDYFYVPEVMDIKHYYGTPIFVYRPDYKTFLLRNSGFCWEPGFFAVILNIGIISGLIQSGFKWKKRFWIYIALIFTTQSTTGLATLLLVGSWYLLNQSSNLRLVLIPAFIFAVILVFNLPFMQKKIIQLMRENPQQTVKRSYVSENDVHPQRFASFRIALIDFKNYPILGFGGSSNSRWFNKLGYKENNLSVISGIGNFMARFGIFGIFLLLALLISTSNSLNRHFKVKSPWMIPLILISIMFSYSIINYALFMSIIFFGWFYEPRGMNQDEN